MALTVRNLQSVGVEALRVTTVVELRIRVLLRHAECVACLWRVQTLSTNFLNDCMAYGHTAATSHLWACVLGSY
jgi:hypothetical protein